MLALDIGKARFQFFKGCPQQLAEQLFGAALGVHFSQGGQTRRRLHIQMQNMAGGAEAAFGVLFPVPGKFTNFHDHLINPQGSDFSVASAPPLVCLESMTGSGALWDQSGFPGMPETRLMTDIDVRLREDVHLLGELLGDTIREQHGEAFLQTIEDIRRSAKADRSGAAEQLSSTLNDLAEDELLPVARAFNQFLNLANIAEQYQLIRRRDAGQADPFEARVLPELLARLKAAGHSDDALARQLGKLSIELVLTAHPTEVARRTLIQKYDAIAAQLAAQDHRDLIPAEREQIRERLQRLIAEAWHTEEIRRTRPTPVDEAKWGFAVIEHSLWHAIPHHLRKVDKALHEATGLHLPLEAAPIRFASWMGGDRDGNPNVTAPVTREVLLLARWMAADLFLRDIDALASELSMQQASEALRAKVGDSAEPYRAVLKQLRDRLRETRAWAHSALQAPQTPSPLVLQHNHDLFEPLHLCFESLHACGMGVIANGP